jgi:hypothetical protein
MRRTDRRSRSLLVAIATLALPDRSALKIARTARAVAAASCLLVATIVCRIGAQEPRSTPSRPVSIDVSKERVGTEPRSFVPIVGDWIIAQDEGKKVVMVDGRKWKRGQPAGGLADKAREIYGARHEDFIDNVAAFAYYPTAVAKDIDNFENGELSVKFKMIGGALDRAQGIMFNLKTNGDWLVVRYNGTEDNLVLWTYTNGKRAYTKGGSENVPLELGTWHEIKVGIHGIKLTASLDGKQLILYDLKEPVNGKVGLWAKTDTMAEFDAFTVTPVSK